jgi:hypothetical protein
MAATLALAFSASAVALSKRWRVAEALRTRAA